MSHQYRRYVALMQSRGFGADRVLVGTGINSEQLLDPAYLVNLEQCQAVILNMVRLTKDQSFGLALGQQTRLTDHGIVGLR